MSRAGRTRSLRQLRHGVPHAFPGGYRGQLERHHEGRSARGLRRRGGLREKLLRGLRHRSDVFRHIRVDGSIRAGQRSGRGAHETPGRVPQTGKRSTRPVKSIYMERLIYMCVYIKMDVGMFGIGGRFYNCYTGPIFTR